MSPLLLLLCLVCCALGAAHELYCPSSSDLAVSYGHHCPGSACSVQLFDQGWNIYGGGGAASKSAFNLLDGYVEYDVDFSGVPTGVNANIYTIVPNTTTYPFFAPVDGVGINTCPNLTAANFACGKQCPFSGQYYGCNRCDGQGVGSTGTHYFCPEDDWIESNGGCGGQTALHTVQGKFTVTNSTINTCNAAGCCYQYQYPADVSAFHMRVDYTASGVSRTTYDGILIDPSQQTPQPDETATQILQRWYTVYGAVIYSSVWQGWVPGSSCGATWATNCSPAGVLANANYTVSNLRIYGTVLYGPTPRLCALPTTTPFPTTTPTTTTPTTTTTTTTTPTTTTQTTTTTSTPTTTITTTRSSTTTTTSTTEFEPLVFDVSATPTSFTVFPGSAFSFTVVFRQLNGDPTSFCWSAAGLPAGVTAVLSPGCGVGTTSSNLALNVAEGTQPGYYQISVGTNIETPLRNTAFISLTVADPSEVLSVSLSATSFVVSRGELVDVLVSVNQNTGSAVGHVWQVSGLPTFISGLFASGVTSGSSTTTLQLEISGAAISGTYKLLVTVVPQGAAISVSPALLTVTIV